MADQNFDHVWVAPLTPLSLLERSARVFPEKTALVYGERRCNFREFAERVNQLGSALRAAGIKPGERVAFLCPNIPPMLEAHFGVPLIGAVLVAINTRLSRDEIGYILNHSEASMLFVDTELAALVPPAEELPHLRQTVMVVDEQAGAPGQRISALEYEQFLASGSPAPIDYSQIAETDTISINYTSGTTGRPKGVMYSHRGAYLNALGEMIEVGLASDSIYLWTLPMFHCNGWCYTWAVAGIGATNICLRKIDPPLVVQLIESERVSHFCGAPTVLILLVNHPAAANLRLPRPLRIVTAGAPPSPTTIQSVEALGAQIIHVYGLTETYGPHTICEWHQEWDGLDGVERARIKARQGVPYIHAQGLRIVDEQMNDVPADGETQGEVVMWGNNLMKGYFHQPEATADAFRGGWFHSGDVGVMCADGYIELRDRKKDIIISGGENISTIEVERTIMQHPAVLECAVAAAPDDLWGEVPHAFVMLKPDATVDEAELIAFCRERLAHFKCPKNVTFTDLPKTSTGKIQKFKLREQLWQGREKRIN